MIKLVEVLGILIIHWIGDSLLQSSKEFKEKAVDNEVLISHTLTYSFFMFFCYTVYLGAIDVMAPDIISKVVGFFLVTYLSCTGIEYVFTKLVDHYWYKEEYQTCSILLSLDQLLRYTQLFITFNYLQSI